MAIAHSVSRLHNQIYPLMLKRTPQGRLTGRGWGLRVRVRVRRERGSGGGGQAQKVYGPAW